MNNQLIIAPGTELTLSGQVSLAMQDIAISDASIETLSIVVSGAIERASFYLGLNKTQSDKDSMKIIVMEDCRRSFKYLKVAEIKLAIDMGSRGEYGEVRGMAPKDVFNWISSYMRAEVRTKIVKSLQKPDDSWQPTEKELSESRRAIIDQSWEKFKKDGFLIDRGNYIYNILDRNKLVNLSIEEKKLFMIEAKSILLKEYDPFKLIVNQFKLKEVKEIRDEILADDNHIRIKNEAKQLALNYFFKKLIEENIELTTLITFDLK